MLGKINPEYVKFLFFFVSVYAIFNDLGLFFIWWFTVHFVICLNYAFGIKWLQIPIVISRIIGVLLLVVLTGVKYGIVICNIGPNHNFYLTPSNTIKINIPAKIIDIVPK